MASATSRHAQRSINIATLSTVRVEHDHSGHASRSSCPMVILAARSTRSCEPGLCFKLQLCTRADPTRIVLSTMCNNTAIFKIKRFQLETAWHSVNNRRFLCDKIGFAELPAEPS